VCSDGQIQIMIWFKSWLSHMWWFDLTTKDLILKHVIWFGFDFNLSWFYFICDLKKSQVSVGYLILLLNEYGPVNNRFFMDILPKYVASLFGNSGTRFQPVAPSSDQGGLSWRLVLWFLDISFFSYKFCAQTIRILFFDYNFIFNLHKFTLPLASAA